MAVVSNLAVCAISRDRTRPRGTPVLSRACFRFEDNNSTAIPVVFIGIRPVLTADTDCLHLFFTLLHYLLLFSILIFKTADSRCLSICHSLHFFCRNVLSGPFYHYRPVIFTGSFLVPFLIIKTTLVFLRPNL